MDYLPSYSKSRFSSAPQAGTFNSGIYTTIKLYMGASAAGIGYIDSIMLIEGTTAPASYKPCRIERCMIEGKFTSDDTVVLENGKVSGLLNWKHRTLYGKDYDWQYVADATGYKQIRLLSAMKDIMFLLNQKIVVKHDGKVLPCTLTVSAADQVRDDWSSSSKDHLDISISDTDSGWAETINPNADEVKAWMNGWRAVGKSSKPCTPRRGQSQCSISRTY